MRIARHLLTVFCVSVVALGLSGCGADSADLPEGVQTVTGLLRSTELSRVRRGTHIIEKDGEALYFVESGSRNLRTYEGKEVTVTGTLERNTDRKALPVLMLSDIQSEAVVMRPWKIPALKMTLSAPDGWQGRTSGSGITFKLTGRTDPLLNIRATPVAQLPKGQSILVGVDQGRIVRDEETGGANVYVEHAGKILLFQFTPPPAAYLPYLNEHFEDALRTVVFDAKAAASAALSVPNGTGSLTTGTGSNTSRRPGVCGGPAGFLCPSGQYCEITDQVNNIGVCKKI